MAPGRWAPAPAAMYYLKTAVQSRPGEEVGRRCGGGAAFVALSEALSVTQPRSRFPRQPQQRSPARVEVGEGGGGRCQEG